MVRVEMKNKEGKEKKKGGEDEEGKDKWQNSYTQHKRINKHINKTYTRHMHYNSMIF
jgi:hypothetical protein